MGGGGQGGSLAVDKVVGGLRSTEVGCPRVGVGMSVAGGSLVVLGWVRVGEGVGWLVSWCVVEVGADAVLVEWVMVDVSGHAVESSGCGEVEGSGGIIPGGCSESVVRSEGDVGVGVGGESPDGAVGQLAAARDCWVSSRGSAGSRGTAAAV